MNSSVNPMFGAPLQTRVRSSANALTAVVTLAALSSLAGCSSSEPSASPVAPVTSTPAPTTTPTTEPTTPPPPEGRKLVDGAAFATSSVNLLVDPNFTIGSDGFTAGTFVAYEELTGAKLALTTSTESRSPAGAGGSVAKIMATNVTDKSSRSALVLSSFLGGSGPFDAKIWVSKSTIDGLPTDVAFGAKGITAMVADGTPNGDSFDMTADDASRRVVGGRTWVLLRTTIPRALPYGGYFIVRAGTGGGYFSLASPEIVAQPLATTAASRPLNAVRAPRATTSEEQAAIARYRSLPQRFVPAGSFGAPKH